MMWSTQNWFMLLGIAVLAAPAVLLAVLGVASLLGRPVAENSASGLTHASVVTGLLAALTILAMMLWFDTRNVPIELGNWVKIEGEHGHHEHFHFHLKFVFDRLSVPFVILSYVLCGTVSAFASKYLHRETGFQRFFILYALFFLGMVVSSLAGTIETLFLGWELVGLSSALLVAYFYERPAPVKNGLRVWGVYRIADAAFLIAAVAMHHLTGEGDFAILMGEGDWPAGVASITESQALFVGLLLLVAAAGKSGLIPFSGWLPRAMEGPTPSSAVFYGALSVHLGAFLLLRVSPLLEKSLLLSAIVVVLGISTAIYAALTARVQIDAKSALAFASLTQVGLIVAEIGLTFRYLALVHIIGHACLRTLQLLRAPSLLRDYRNLENAMGTRLPDQQSTWSARLPEGLRIWAYRMALERGYLDSILNTFVVNPFVRIFQRFDSWERRWTDWLSGQKSRESDALTHEPSDIVEGL